MTTHAHKTAALGQIHSPVNWTFSTASLRRAVGAYVATDLGSECMQTDTSPPTFWKLAAISGAGLSVTPTWVQITTAADATFNGNFAALVAGATVLTCMQPDLALVEDTTLLQTSGSTAVLTFSGTRSGSPTAITVTCPTTGGARGTWQGVVTYGDGSTQSFASAATVALTGLGAGLTLNIAVGTVATGNTWKALAATCTDQGAGGKNWVKSGSAAPLIVTGANGRTEIQTDGSTQGLDAAAITLAGAPSVTPIYMYSCFSVTAKGSNQQFFSDSIGAEWIIDSAGGALSDVRQYNGSAANSQTIVSNKRYRMIARWGGGAGGNDSLKFGANAAVATGSAGNPSAGAYVYTAGYGGSFRSAMKIGLHIITLGLPSNIAALDAAVAAYWAGQYET